MALNFIATLLLSSHLAIPPQTPQEPALGMAAPEAVVNVLENGASGKEVRLSGLKGKVVVMEFWATWCGPCTESLPHLAKLAQKHKDVQFLAITQEDPKRVQAFLNKRPSQLTFAIDKGTTFRSYGVMIIPHTVVIDKTGKIAAITSPEKVTDEVLERVARGEDAKLEVKKDIAANLDPEPSVTPPILRTVIRESFATGGASKMSKDRIAADGVSVIVAYTLAYGSSYLRSQFDLNEAETQKPYYFEVSVSKSRPETLLPTFQQALSNAFGYKVQRTPMERDVLVLKVKDGVRPKVTESKATESSSFFKHNGLKAAGAKFAAVAEFLESVTRKIVVDETGLLGRYDFEIQWIPRDTESMTKAFDSLGLELVPAKRLIEILKVSK